MLAWIGAGVLLAVWGVVEICLRHRRHPQDDQTGLDGIKGMEWKQFERLVCEAYRRRGYKAMIVGNDAGKGAEGGKSAAGRVDIRLDGYGETALVQCRQWQVNTVDVTTLRELLEVVVSKKANRGIIVTSGSFTVEARNFVRGHRQIELMDGHGLAELIKGIQPGSTDASPEHPEEAAAYTGPRCPFCSATMVLRIAQKPPHEGLKFWACSKYPTCRGMRWAEGSGPVAKPGG
jgi:restriction system protein